MTKRLMAVLGVTALAMLIFAATASAEPKVNSNQRLRVQVDPNQSGCATADSTAGWVVGQDAPGDGNSRLFQTDVGSGGCVLLFSNASFNWHIAVGNQRGSVARSHPGVDLARPQLHGGRGEHQRQQLDH